LEDANLPRYWIAADDLYQPVHEDLPQQDPWKLSRSIGEGHLEWGGKRRDCDIAAAGTTGRNTPPPPRPVVAHSQLPADGMQGRANGGRGAKQAAVFGRPAGWRWSAR
jgi:hypothetical protein